MATTFQVPANNASSTLSASIVGGDLACTLVSSTSFPTTYPFPITIDSEIIKVTDNNTGTGVLTIVRAQEGTSAAAHSSGAIVSLKVTAKFVSDLNTAVNTLENNSLPKQMTENDPLLLDAAISGDGYYSGICETGTAGTALVFGKLCYLAVADSKWELADANTLALANAKLAICVSATIAENASGTFLLWGKVNAASLYPTLTIGAKVYVGETAGNIQVAAPTGVTDLIRVVGYANTADELFFRPFPSASDAIDDTAGGTDGAIYKAASSNVAYDISQEVITGWIPVSDSWTYASATTITVPSGAASIYQKGDKIKLTQTTVKYFYIVGVADTVLTITGGTSYTLADAAISVQYYSHVANPMGFPHWFTFVPTITGSTGSIGTFSQDVYYGAFCIIGRTAFINASTVVTNVGSWSGNLQCQMPVNPVAELTYLLSGGGIGTYNTVIHEGLSRIVTTAGIMNFISNLMVTIYPYSSLATNDVISITINYGI